METRPGAASRLGRTRGRGRRGRGRRPGPWRQRGPWRLPAGSGSSSSTQRTARCLRAGAPAARPGRVQEQPPPLLQQLLALLPPPLLQLLPQPPPRARAPPAANPPLAAAPPPRGRSPASASRARRRPARPQQPGARRALAAAPPPAPGPRRRRLGAHFNTARGPGAQGRLAPRPLPIPSGPLAWGPPAPALCGGLVTGAAPGTSQIRGEAGRPVAPACESVPPREPALLGRAALRATSARLRVPGDTRAGDAERNRPFGVRRLSGCLHSERLFIFFFNSGVPLSNLITSHDLVGLSSADSRYPGVLKGVKLFSSLVFLS